MRRLAISPDVWQGLYVTVAGMGLVFLSLSILMLAMIILDRVFRRPPTEKKIQEAAASSESTVNNEALVAALAVALAMSPRKVPPVSGILSAVPEKGATASAWSLAGRQRLMNSRNLRGR